MQLGYQQFKSEQPNPHLYMAEQNNIVNPKPNLPSLQFKSQQPKLHIYGAGIIRTLNTIHKLSSL